MARIRKVEIRHFRGIQSLDWCPNPGINCLIGPGDSGKSSILDAIDLCLGARRNLQFTDADFHGLDVATPITIDVTIGDLNAELKSFDVYGMYLRSFNAVTGSIEDEPEREAETVLSIRLSVESDLEPEWTLVSERAVAQGLARNIAWADRLRLAPTRVGAMADYHLGWRRGSVLNRVSDERADASAALAKAARDARAVFGAEVQGQLQETLSIVSDTAKDLGIPVGDTIQALLDAHSVSFGGGTIALHDEDGIPLRGLGLGSTRLLIAGLQRRAAQRASIVLVDELEHGLEPHRIIRFLGSLGAKDDPPPLQAFLTTHSPVALCELAGTQLFVTRQEDGKHVVSQVGGSNATQSTIRLYPDAFLAASVLVCEGASEVGLVRGLDRYRASNGTVSIAAQGMALVDCGGGSADTVFERASAFRALGYRAAVLRDADKAPSAGVEDGFKAAGGIVVAWRPGRASEDELFLSLTPGAVGKLLAFAIELHGRELIGEHIKSATGNSQSLEIVEQELAGGVASTDTRNALGRASRFRRAGWFKSVTGMEAVASEIVGPDLPGADAGFRGIVDSVFAWSADARG